MKRKRVLVADADTALARGYRMKLHEIASWGRSFEEYRRMFSLSDADLSGRILGCGDGPARRVQWTGSSAGARGWR